MTATETTEQLTTLAEEIEAFVRQRDHVSFVEIGRRFGERYPLKGTQALAVSPECPAVYFWADMSELFVSAIQSLTRAGRIHMKTCDPLVYLCDGESLSLPIVEKLPSKGSQREQWLPVCLRPGPS